MHSMSMLSVSFNYCCRIFRHPPPLYVSKCIKRLSGINYTLSVNDPMLYDDRHKTGLKLKSLFELVRVEVLVEFHQCCRRSSSEVWLFSTATTETKTTSNSNSNINREHAHECLEGMGTCPTAQPTGVRQTNLISVHYGDAVLGYCSNAIV